MNEHSCKFERLHHAAHAAHATHAAHTARTGGLVLRDVRDDALKSREERRDAACILQCRAHDLRNAQ